MLSAGAMGFMHGTNDAQKTMGIIALTLLAATKAGQLANIARLALVSAHARAAARQRDGNRGMDQGRLRFDDGLRAQPSAAGASSRPSATRW